MAIRVRFISHLVVLKIGVSNMNTQYDEIYDSIVNGQFKQFVEQFDELSTSDQTEWLNYVAYELDQPDMVVRAMQAYFNVKGR